MQLFTDLVVPLRCVSCGAIADGDLCAPCAEGVEVLAPPWCDRCGGRLPCSCRSLEGFGRARSLVAFVEPSRRLTLVLKRRGSTSTVSAIGSLLAALSRREGLSGDVVTFVPGGRAARRRGFDHGELLARAVASGLGLRTAPLLRRTREGPRQADVPLAERRSNVSSRFAARRTAGSVLLVDDVYTTGATVEACALALRRAGAPSVDVVTWARTLLRRYV
jgi:predicted amidophosphoribosyltransferase